MQRKTRKWRKKYPISEYIKDALKKLLPPENISVSQWAEKYRVLDSQASAMPGPWRNDRTPYLNEIMDELCNYETEEIYFCKCTQVGGSEASLNMLGYVIQQDPSPTMIVYPSDKLGESISENRIKTMLKSSPALKRLFKEFQSQKLELQFDGMYLTISGANSPSSLASKAIKYLFLDEVDKYPGASKKEADPISLARERVKTFRNSKVYLTSTPTISEGHIWKSMMGADMEKHYFVPCPHCGEYIELKFKQIKFPESAEGMTASDRADQAVYVCQECGCVITDYHKDRMLQHGRWQIGSSNPMMSHFKMSKINKPDSKAFGMTLVLVDGDKYKDMIAARMKKQNGRGAWMVYEGCDMEYAEQVTAEHKVNVKVGTRTVQRWKPKRSHADNHYLDCEVYAFAAADIMGVRSMHLEDVPEETEKKRQRTDKTDEESWIEENEGWI